MAKAHIKKLFSYGIFGVIVSLIYVLCTIFFTEAVGLTPIIASALAYITSFMLSFFANHHIVFKSKESISKTVVRFALVSAFVFALTTSIMYLTVDVFNISYLYGIVVVLVIIPLSNFLINLCWTFKEGSTIPITIYKLRDYFYVQKKLYVLVSLFGLWCVYLWGAFGADRSFALYADNEFFIGTVLSSMSATLSHGEWPLRMDTILGGVPLYNFTQLSAFYPFYLVSFPIYSSALDVVHSMHWVTLIHLLILEINMYVFIRTIGASRLAALTGSALVAFSANSFAYAVWMNIVVPYAWLPLYLAGLIGLLNTPRSAKYFVMALGGIVLLTLASPAQPLIHAIFLSIIFVSAHGFKLWNSGEGRQISHGLVSLIAVAVLAILLVSPVILPAALEFKNMIRWIGPFPPVIGNAKIPFSAFQFDQLTIADLGGVFFKFKSAAVGSQFVGVLEIALASVAVVSRPRSWIVIALVFIAVYALVSSTGSNLGLAYLNYIIPILNKIREPSRFLVLFQFAVGVLAAFGVDELRKTVSRTEDCANANQQLIALSITAFVSIIALFVAQDRIVATVPPFVSVAILVALTLMTWIAIWSNLGSRNTIIASVWGGAALTLLAIEVTWIPPPVSSSQYLTTGALSLDKAIERVTTLDPNHEYRVVFDGEIDKQQAAMLASYQGVRTFNAYFNPAPLRQFEELYYHGPRADNYFRILGAKYLICSECAAESLHGYTHLENIAGYELYETKDVLPHSYIVHRLNGNFLDLADFVAKAANLDLTKKFLFVEKDVVVGINGNTDAAEDGCISREDIRTANRSRFVVQCKLAGVLVLNEFFDDAWVARVDGVKMNTLRVNGNQMGVNFTSGSHIIEFQYLPTIFIASLCLTLVGLLFLIFVTTTRIFLPKIKLINRFLV
jgi:putative flippase GtrA